nr:hypothetical protein BaRGS_016029 [Batillaria attramentaria]
MKDGLRLHHYNMSEKEEASKEEWMSRLQNTHVTRADMNKLIMNYLVTEGFKEAAEKFRMEAGVTPPVELDALDDRIQLRSLKLIELIRDKDVEAALHYAQTHLSERVEENPEVMSELEKTLALLAFENPENSPFGELLHPSQRHKVASELNAAILEVDATPHIASLLKLLLWGQDELDKRKVKYPRMTDIAQGKIEDPK